MNNPILFLDHDSVMVTGQYYGYRFNHPNKWNVDKFDPKCVKIVNSIVEFTGADIVCSSDWRFEYSIEVMREIYTYFGMVKGPIDYTPSSNSYLADNLAGGRADEVMLWLDAHPEVTTWCCVDDLPMEDKWSERYTGHFIRCKRYLEGIKQTGLKEKIIKILHN